MPREIKSVWVKNLGNTVVVMVKDENGIEIPEYQGPLHIKCHEILKATEGKDDVKFWQQFLDTDKFMETGREIFEIMYPEKNKKAF